MEYKALKRNVDRFRDDLNQRKGQRDNLLEQKRRKQARIADLKQEVDKLRQIARLFVMAGEYARQESKETMERLVTNALKMVFQGDHAFHIDFEERADRSEAEFTVSSAYGGNQTVQNDPYDSRGGGVVDVISLALRVAILETSRPPLEGPLILDEPGKHVSEQHVRQVAEFLNAVCNSFDRQVIMVTHNQHLADAGATSYHIEIKNGESVVYGRTTGFDY
jgi:DNA repair exonuclease SbcCD ATPase subunit